jgi:predicted DCC family thiol-disulfide oxidoreductase YuxK
MSQNDSANDRMHDRVHDRMSSQRETGAVIVFDGVCVLCNGWVGFLLRHDRKQRYRFAPMQGDAGRRLLAENGLDPDDPLSFLLVEYDRHQGEAATPRVSTDSDAVGRVLMGLGGAWRLVAVAAVLPRAVRDPLYRLVARNRYRWFGRHDACLLPDPEQAWRFL